jgi:hypothetical protein
MGKNENDTNVALVDKKGQPLDIYGSDVSDLKLGERRVFRFSAQIKEQDNALSENDDLVPDKE